MGGPKEANRLTRILDAWAAVPGSARFPVPVEQLALGCAEIYKWSDPITKVEAANIPGFEGALHPSNDRKRWLLLYNASISSTGRIRFTQAHELGHYILHRSIRESFDCTEDDMLNWTATDQSLEAEADEFASYLLMPLNDYRQQVNTAVDLDLMGHCADRYGVSLTAAILKWLSYTDETAVAIVSTEGFMKWAWSSQPAFRAGAFFKTKSQTIAIPAGSIAGDASIQHERKGVEVPATAWFPHAHPQLSAREMKLWSEQYESVITLLVLPRGTDVWPQREWDED